MNRRKYLWAGIIEDEKAPIIPPFAKKNKFDNKQSTASNSVVSIKIKNPIVTQTIEVMKQTEMLQSLIETYSNKLGSNNYLLNPSQLIPQVDFHPENATKFDMEGKFAKPFGFIPPIQNDFSCAIPKSYPDINKDVCLAALRKAISGHLRMSGFVDATDTALSVFIDATEEYIRCFLDQIRDIQLNNSRKNDNVIDIPTLEKAYYALYNTSITNFNNYFKNCLIARNRNEINEFKTVMQEYNKLITESQKLNEDLNDNQNYLNVIEITSRKNDEVKNVMSNEEAVVIADQNLQEVL